MISQKEYWDKKIKDWTRISYTKKAEKIDFIEKIANFFRGPIIKRMEITLEIVGPKVKGKTVLDMGCGLGDFCFGAVKYQPKKVIGIDISKVAIKEASRIAKGKNLLGLIEFMEGDLGKVKRLPKFDMAVGLGFIDYLNKEELKRLFSLLRGQSFFFSFFEKKFSLINFLHSFYVRIRKCPGAFKYTRKEIQSFAPKDLGLRFFEKDGLLFITNIITNI